VPRKPRQAEPEDGRRTCPNPGCTVSREDATHTPTSEQILVAALPNLRDLGGRPTRDGGRVRSGLLYRSTDLAKLDGDGAAAFARLGIRTVYDLRTKGERAANPDRLSPGTAYVVADVLAGSTQAAPVQLADVFADPKVAVGVFGNGRGVAFFVQAYREFVTLDSARAAYGRLFSDLTHAEHRPALFHCSTGKDRTGWAAAALLMLLGVPDDRVLEDYLLSGTRLLATVQPVFDEFQARGGDPELLYPLMSVRPEYLDSALVEMRRTFGTVEGYFAEGLGLDAGAQRVLRETLVERGPALSVEQSASRP
jgi:protein-tyrosine phosphatase